jgi:hypothetical protein
MNPPASKASTQWTPRVASLLLSSSFDAEQPVPVSIEGPFGNPVNMSKSDVVVILTGGTGLPPGISVAWEAIHASKPVHFAWSSSGDKLESMSVLQKLKTKLHSLKIHKTGKGGSESGSQKSGGSEEPFMVATAPGKKDKEQMVSADEATVGGDDVVDVKVIHSSSVTQQHHQKMAENVSVLSGRIPFASKLQLFVDDLFFYFIL